ncbi:hypothetical protein QS257_18370 [Terrilactibacillus sp. S3-3]|nr:hypothetical protein QS257_18370 [Terrilactibacillus sp. S3-3]
MMEKTQDTKLSNRPLVLSHQAVKFETSPCGDPTGGCGGNTGNHGGGHHGGGNHGGGGGHHGGGHWPF